MHEKSLEYNVLATANLYDLPWLQEFVLLRDYNNVKNVEKIHCLKFKNTEVGGYKYSTHSWKITCITSENWLKINNALLFASL